MARLPFLMPPCRSTLRASRPSPYPSCKLASINSSSVNNDLNRAEIRYYNTSEDPHAPWRRPGRLRKDVDRPTITTRFRVLVGLPGGEFFPGNLTLPQPKRADIRRVPAAIWAEGDGR